MWWCCENSNIAKISENCFVYRRQYLFLKNFFPQSQLEFEAKSAFKKLFKQLVDGHEASKQPTSYSLKNLFSSLWYYVVLCKFSHKPIAAKYRYIYIVVALVLLY